MAHTHHSFERPCLECGSENHSTSGHKKLEEAAVLHPVERFGELPTVTQIRRARVSLKRDSLNTGQSLEAPCIVRIYQLPEGEVMTLEFSARPPR